MFACYTFFMGVSINFEQKNFDFFCLEQTSKNSQITWVKMFWVLLFIAFNQI